MVLPQHRGVPKLLVLFFFTGLPSLQYWCLYTLLLLFQSRSRHVSTLKSQGLTAIHRLCSSSIHGSGGCPLYRSCVCPISLPAFLHSQGTPTLENNGCCLCLQYLLPWESPMLPPTPAAHCTPCLSSKPLVITLNISLVLAKLLCLWFRLHDEEESCIFCPTPS